MPLQKISWSLAAGSGCFSACPALYSIEGRRCCSLYLLQTVPSNKMETLQLAVAEDPMEPCCWLWPYFLPAQLSTLFKEVLEALDTCCKVTKRIFCNMPLQKVHWSLAAGSGHVHGKMIKTISYVVIAFCYRKANILRRWSYYYRLLYPTHFLREQRPLSLLQILLIQMKTCIASRCL